MFVPSDTKIGARTKIGNIGSDRFELEQVYVEESFPDGRRGADQAHEEKVYVFCDSWLCVGKIHEYPYSNIECENRISCVRGTHRCRELDGIDGYPVEFELRMHPGHTSLQIVYEIQKHMDSLTCSEEDLQGRIILMSIFNDIKWTNADNEKICSANAQIVSMYAKRIASGHWSFLVPGSEMTWYNTLKVTPGGK